MTYLDSLEKGTAPLIAHTAGKDVLYDKLYKLYTELLTTREHAQDEKRLFQKNLEDIAHQIKTPITAMLLSCENTVQKGTASLDHAGEAALVKNLNRLDELTDRLLHAASLEAGSQTMRMSRFSVFEACLEAYEHCEHLFKQQGIAVHIEPAPAVIHADYYWITEAFMNVFKNAASYLAKGNTVQVSFAETPLYVQAVFKDDGAGISKEALKFLFNRFYKTPDSQGFGLGLHIAKSIAEKNNGTLCAYNEKGAVFQFTFYKN
ncbi:MAG: sensor histidine kinase [Treponema sp.]